MIAPSQTNSNIFLQFYNLSKEEKKNQFGEITSEINSSKDQLDVIEENIKHKIICQILYLKITSFDANKNSDILTVMKVLQKTSEEVINLIILFHKYVAKIMGFLRDKELFYINEIIELALHPSDLIKMCLDAVEYIQEESAKTIANVALVE